MPAASSTRRSCSSPHWPRMFGERSARASRPVSDCRASCAWVERSQLFGEHGVRGGAVAIDVLQLGVDLGRAIRAAAGPARRWPSAGRARSLTAPCCNSPNFSFASSRKRVLFCGEQVGGDRRERCPSATRGPARARRAFPRRSAARRRARPRSPACACCAAASARPRRRQRRRRSPSSAAPQIGARAARPRPSTRPRPPRPRRAARAE